jgi:hypothetical protein
LISKLDDLCTHFSSPQIVHEVYREVDEGTIDEAESIMFIELKEL